MSEVHKTACGPHMNHILARKILRMGYFWSTIEAIASSVLENAIYVRYMPINFISFQFHYITSSLGPSLF